MRKAKGVSGREWVAVAMALFVLCGSGAALTMNSALPSFVVNQNLYACTSRDDCCLKAMGTLRNMISTATTYTGTGIKGVAIYPKCSRSFNYDPNGNTCTRTVPFEPSISHSAFDSLATCLNPALSSSNAGDIWQRQKECLRPFWMVHQECITRTFNNCLRQNGRCDSAYFNDWLNQTIVDLQYV
jgi:hypothetical protein